MLSSPRRPFATYAVSLLKRKVGEGDIKSKSAIEKWGFILGHLIASRLGELYMDQIRPSDIVAWKADMAKLIHAEDDQSAAMNAWFAVLKVVLKHAKIEFSLPSNPADGIEEFDTSRHRTNTYEEPRSLETQLRPGPQRESS